MNIEPCNVNRNSLRGIKINRIMRRTMNNQLTMRTNVIVITIFPILPFEIIHLQKSLKQTFNLLRNNCALSFGPNLF